MTLPTADNMLHEIEDAAALLRYLTACAAASAEHPDPAVLSGMSDLCRHLEMLARSTRRALSFDALETEIRVLPD